MEKTNTANSKPKRIIDPLDYDLSLDIHDDPLRHPGTPYPYKDDEEFEIIHDAYYVGLMKKDRPKDYTEYLQMWNEYKNTTTYKRQIAAYERYKERLALLRKKGEADPTEYLEALMAWNEDRLSYER